MPSHYHNQLSDAQSGINNVCGKTQSDTYPYTILGHTTSKLLISCSLSLRSLITDCQKLTTEKNEKILHLKAHLHNTQCFFYQYISIYVWPRPLFTIGFAYWMWYFSHLFMATVGSRKVQNDSLFVNYSGVFCHQKPNCNWFFQSSVWCQQ